MDDTKRGYLSDPLAGDFTAKVTRAEDAGDGLRKVWLDNTLFYPESGGQPDDRGTLGGFKVEGVSEEDGVCHLVRGSLEAGDKINGHVDMARRFDHMQQHTGQHILSRVFVSLGGLMTVGFHLGETASTIDFRDDTAGSGFHLDLFSPHAFRQEIEASGTALYSWSAYYDGAYPLAAIKRFLNPHQLT